MRGLEGGVVGGVVGVGCAEGLDLRRSVGMVCKRSFRASSWFVLKLECGRTYMFRTSMDNEIEVIFLVRRTKRLPQRIRFIGRMRDMNFPPVW